MADDNSIKDSIKDKVTGTLKDAGRLALFLPALANLQWSRGYTWYVELDDVPPPFHRGGVLGLPATDVTYELAQAEPFSFNAGITSFDVPMGVRVNKVQLTVLDDEQATIFTFFERWYNEVYNVHAGVLPLTEACKMISIYKLHTTRTPVTRYAWNYDLTTPTQRSENKVNSRQLLVFPSGTLQENEKSNTGDPRSYSIELTVANQQDPDYGNPSVHEGSVFGMDIDSNSFWAKAADYI